MLTDRLIQVVCIHMQNQALLSKLAQFGSTNLCPIAVMIKNGSILRGHRHYTPDKWKEISVWTMPGGRCDKGETLEQTLRREVREEVNITKFQIEAFIGEVAGAKEGDRVPIFFCTTDEDPTLMEPAKFSEWKWVPIADYLVEVPKFNPAAKECIIAFLKERRLV